MDWFQACRAADVAPESARLVDMGARKILIVHSAGRFFASGSRCPHLGVSLENGEIGGGALRCRGHGYKLDLATGDCVSEKGLRLDVYRAELRDGWVWVELA